MGTSFKFKKFLDSTGITHKKELLSDILEATFVNWKPTLSCIIEANAPTVSYTLQEGKCYKIRISNDFSLVYVSINLRGKITAIASSQNHAVIRGLPFKATQCETFNFNCFYKGIKNDEYIPSGFFEDYHIRIQRNAPDFRGATVATWAVNDTDFEIKGSGFYVTNN